jgi:hypothetical protein
MIFGGKEMKEGSRIGEYGVDTDYVVQAMIID